jgi:hypothetical protein
MSNTSLLQAVDYFEAIVATIVGQRMDSMDLNNYCFPKFKQHLEGVRDLLVMQIFLY